MASLRGHRRSPTCLVLREPLAEPGHGSVGSKTYRDRPTHMKEGATPHQSRLAER
jgi:hypothetical protein